MITKHTSAILYLIMFYTAIVMFFWNFKTFTYQEKTIMFAIISGFQCISSICDNKQRV